MYGAIGAACIRPLEPRFEAVQCFSERVGASGRPVDRGCCLNLISVSSHIVTLSVTQLSSVVNLYAAFGAEARTLPAGAARWRRMLERQEDEAAPARVAH